MVRSIPNVVFACAALVACRDSRSLGPVENLPPEEVPVATIASPTGGPAVEVVAVVGGMRYPARSGGCTSGEVLPGWEGPTPGSLDASATFNARVAGVTATLAGTPRPDGFIVGSGPMRRAIEPARADAHAGKVESCWSADGSVLALRASVDAPREWSYVRFTGGKVEFGAALLGREDACATALGKSGSAAWHPTTPR